MKPKLLAIGHSYVVALNRALLREVQKRGNIDVTVVAPSFFHSELRALHAEPEPEDSGLKLQTIPCVFTRKIHLFFYSPLALKRVLRTVQPDWVYLWEEPYIVSGVQIARELNQTRTPYSVYTCQNLAKTYPWPFRAFENYVINRSQAMWACGLKVDEALVKKGFSATRRQVVPFYVDIERFRPFTFDEKKAGRARLGLSQGPVIGFLGRFTEEKGCRPLMRIAEAVMDRTSAQVLLIGSGPLEGDIRAWSAKFGKRVKVLSATHDEVPQLLPLMDVLLSPSQPTVFWEEQFGRMLIEAFAAGVAVIGSRSGEIPHVIGEAGRVVEPTDVAGWVQAATQLVEERETRENLIQKGLARANLYSAATIAALVEQNVLDGLKQIK